MGSYSALKDSVPADNFNFEYNVAFQSLPGRTVIFRQSSISGHNSLRRLDSMRKRGDKLRRIVLIACKAECVFPSLLGIML